MLYLACALIFPESLDQHGSYREYFYNRRRGFFGVLIAVYAMDYLDTWIKGDDYLHSFGIVYPLRNGAYIVACAIAMATRKVWYYAVFAIAGVTFQVWWIVYQFEVL